MNGAVGMEGLSLKRLCEGGLGVRELSLGMLEDMLRKALDMGISVHCGPFPAKENLESGGGLIYQGL